MEAVSFAPNIFDKMLILMCLSFAVTLKYSHGVMQDCSQKNTTCEDIKLDKGFRFLHSCPEKSTVRIYENQTLIAHVKLGGGTTPARYLREGMVLDNSSFFMKECHDLVFECITPHGHNQVRDSCLIVKIGETVKPVYSDPQWDLKIGGGVAGGLVFLVIGICWFYLKKKKQCAKAAASLICIHHQGVTKTGGTEITRLRKKQPKNDQNEVQDNDKNFMFELQQLKSHDPQAEGEHPKTSDAITIDETQASEHGDTNLSDDTSEEPAKLKHSSHDPGGVNDNTGRDTLEVCPRTEGKHLETSKFKSINTKWTTQHGNTNKSEEASNHQTMHKIRGMQNRWTLGDQCSEEETEEKSLLPDKGGSIQCSDMTGEDEALVDRASPDSVSRCSTAPSMA